MRALIFMRSGNQQVFLGIASPRAVRDRLIEIFPVYDGAYRDARAAALGGEFENVIFIR